MKPMCPDSEAGCELFMDEETKRAFEHISNELEKQKELNAGILKCIEDLREWQERTLEILSGK